MNNKNQLAGQDDMNDQGKLNQERACPVCLSGERNLLYHQNFNDNKDIALTNQYDVVSCRQCGFVFASGIPSKADFDTYYEKLSKYEFSHRSGRVAGDYLSYYQKVVDFLEPFIVDKETEILDMGCSTGALLSVFKERGYSRLLGVDPSPSCVKSVKDLYGIDSVLGNIDNLHSEAKFDLVILSAVLEHLVDIRSAIFKIRDMLTDRGLLFIEVPDAENFVFHLSAPFQQFSVEHINYFSREALKNLLSVCSFELVKTRQNKISLNSIIEPDIFMLARRGGRFDGQIVKDEISESAIRNYIIASSEEDLVVKKSLQKKLAGIDKIIVWGAGTHTQRLLNSGLDLSKILFFVDSNASYVGKKLNGIIIKSPNEIRDKTIPILISTRVYQGEITKHIKKF